MCEAIEIVKTMRKEAFSVGDYVHIYNRGNRKQPIVKDIKDRWRFLRSLYYFNTWITPENLFRDLGLLRFDLNTAFEWPINWQPRKPIVKIIAFILADNHFHILAKEISAGGISLFMKRLGNGITGYFNLKYQESGRLFQGSYRAKRVADDVYIRYLSVYIQVKNAFELFPGGLKAAAKNFDKAYEWASNFPFCSLGYYTKRNHLPVVEDDILCEIFKSPMEYKKFAKECITGTDLDKYLEGLTFVEI